MKALAILPLIAAGLAARGETLLNEPFTYADGPLAAGSGGLWINHSGTTPLNVSGGAALLDQAGTTGGMEDLNRLLSRSFDPATDNTSVLYAGFSVNFSALPTAGTAGSYFAHFKSSAANEFYARVGANTEGAGAGAFRLALANEAWSSAASIEYPLDLQVGVSYEVIVRLDLSTDQSTLWINPSDSGSLSITATDTIGYAAGEIQAFALRQGTSGSGAAAGGPGTLLLDNLVVGTSFDEVRVIPEPGTWALMATGTAALVFGLRRRR